MNVDALILTRFALPDLLAVVLLFLAWLVIGWLTESPPAGQPSVSVLMKRYRRGWMRQFVGRDNRIFDGNILTSLREGTAFFASACIIGTGGLLALIGNGERLRGIVREFDLDAVSATTGYELRLLVTMFFVVNAFLKFVWAHRLFGYCAVMMASVPNRPDDPAAVARAMQAADLNINAARNYNAGLRSIYFALASLTWLAGPWALLSGTAVVLFVSWRREFASTSRRVILRALPEPELPDPVARNLANAPRSSDQVPSRANMPHANGEPPPAAPRSKVDQGPLAP